MRLIALTATLAFATPAVAQAQGVVTCAQYLQAYGQGMGALQPYLQYAQRETERLDEARVAAGKQPEVGPLGGGETPPSPETWAENVARFCRGGSPDQSFDAAIQTNYLFWLHAACRFNPQAC